MVKDIVSQDVPFRNHQFPAAPGKAPPQTRRTASPRVQGPSGPPCRGRTGTYPAPAGTARTSPQASLLPSVSMPRLPRFFQVCSRADDNPLEEGVFAAVHHGICIARIYTESRPLGKWRSGFVASKYASACRLTMWGRLRRLQSMAAGAVDRIRGSMRVPAQPLAGYGQSNLCCPEPSIGYAAASGSGHCPPDRVILWSRRRIPRSGGRGCPACPQRRSGRNSGCDA